MTWLTPLTGLLLAAALIPPLILLYFLKLRRRPLAIPSTLLWMRSLEDLQANAPFQRLRRNLLLFLQLLAILLLAIALMQPQVQAGQLDGGRMVLLIDTSASMSATDGPGGITRLEQAKRLARDRIEAMHGGGLFTSAPDETMIIAFSDRAEIVSRFTNSRQQLLAAIDQIQPTHGETRIEEALRLARAYTTNVVDEMGEARPTGEPAHLELFSDGQIQDMLDQVLRGETMTFHAIGGESPNNVAISTISAERPFDRPNAIEVFASLLNFNTHEVVCDIQLSVNGVARGIREVTIPAGAHDEQEDRFRPGRKNVVFAPFDLPLGAVIEVANLRQDHLMVDNVAQLVVPPPRRLRVALVAPKSFVSQTAIEGMPLQRLEILSMAEFERQAALGPLEQFDVIVLDHCEPEHLPPGRYLSLGGAPPVEGLNPFGRSDRQLILTTRDQHPVMRFVNLDNLVIRDFTLTQPSREFQRLADGNQGPAIVELNRGGIHLIHVNFDPLDSTWPFLRSFGIFMFNAIEYLGHAGEAVTAASIRPGEAISTRLPAGASNIEMREPGGRAYQLTPSDTGHVSWGPVVRTGIHVMSWTDPATGERDSRAFAVNLLSESEGNLRVLESLEVGGVPVDVRRAGASAYTALWPWAIGLCLALLMLEWWVYHRKATV